MFDPQKSYDDNYSAGPQQDWVVGREWPLLRYLDSPSRFLFLDKPLHLPFGIPAGPLLNAEFMNRALDAGFCMPTYKTVRSCAYPSHPLPNVLEVAQFAEASRTAVARPLMLSVTDTSTSHPFSITNSFGVPSMEPMTWQQDFNSLPLPSGYLNVLSFQPTSRASWEEFLEDAKRIATLAAKTNTNIFEVNLSCPNEKGLPLYHDFVRATAVLKIIREQLPHVALIAKIGELSREETLTFVRQTCETIDAISALNTLRCRVLDAHGQPALGVGREFGGVCGRFIFDRGIFMIKSLASARRRLGLSPRRFGLIGVGGVFTAADVESYLNAGADVVQAATGAMWNLRLAAEVAGHLRVRTEVRPSQSWRTQEREMPNVCQPSQPPRVS